jgi:uncharacterized protein (TIGR03437 family)
LRVATIIGTVLILDVLTGAVLGQVLSDTSLSGKYFVRHVQFTTDANNTVTHARSITGAMTFDGQGSYSFTGQQAIGTGTAANFAAKGTYSMDSSGAISLTNPQTAVLTVNGRYGTEAVIGSSTEASTSTFDLFVAIPAPPSTASYSNANLAVSYDVVDFELTGASTAQVRDSVGPVQFSGNGIIESFNAAGHGASIDGGAFQVQGSYTGTYSVDSDGSGTLVFQPPSSIPAASALVGTGIFRNLAVSATGNVFLAGTPGGHDILIGLHAVATDGLTPASFTGRYWVSGMETDMGGPSSSYVGSGTVITGDGAVVLSERQKNSSTPSPFSVTSAADYVGDNIKGGKEGTALIGIGSTTVVLGNGSTFVAADLGVNEATGQPSGEGSFAIGIGVRIPALTGPGVFVNPQGIINAAGNAPVGNPISPGEFIAIYGSGLAPQTLTATPPYPASLGGVSVSIGGFPAPIYLVSSGQINCLVPYEASTASGSTAIVVTNNGAFSNSVNAPIAPTSPGVFSNDLTGTGDGAITHASGVLVSSASPAAAGETLVIYLTGLGALQNPIVDGQAPNPEGADNSVVPVQIEVDGVASPKVSYAGINPVYPGLYQIDFVVPTIPDHGEVSLLIVAGNAATQEVTLFAQ